LPKGDLPSVRAKFLPDSVDDATRASAAAWMSDQGLAAARIRSELSDYISGLTDEVETVEDVRKPARRRLRDRAFGVDRP
jgi:hypothetical protein